MPGRVSKLNDLPELALAQAMPDKKAVILENAISSRLRVRVLYREVLRMHVWHAIRVAIFLLVSGLLTSAFFTFVRIFWPDLHSDLVSEPTELIPGSRFTTSTLAIILGRIPVVSAFNPTTIVFLVIILVAFGFLISLILELRHIRFLRNQVKTIDREVKMLELALLD